MKSMYVIYILHVRITFCNYFKITDLEQKNSELNEKYIFTM